MYSVAAAPNPGYSLLLSKSSVVFTTLWAVTFFHSPITIRSAVAIAVIVASSASIMVRRSAASPGQSKRWLLPATGAFFCWGFLSLIGKHIQADGVATTVFLTYLFAVANRCIVIEMRVRGVAGGVDRCGHRRRHGHVR